MNMSFSGWILLFSNLSDLMKERNITWHNSIFIFYIDDNFLILFFTHFLISTSKFASVVLNFESNFHKHPNITL